MAHQNFRLKLALCKAVCLFLFFNVFFLPGGVFSSAYAEDPPTFVMSFGTSGSGDGQFNRPQSVAVDSSGNIYVVDELNYRIQKFGSNGAYIGQFGTQGTGNGQFNNLFGISIDSSDNIYVVEVDGLNRIQKFSNSGTYLSQIGSSGSGKGQFITPTDIAFDSSGNRHYRK
jgi:tripartite motif-containing protein 71